MKCNLFQFSSLTLLLGILVAALLPATRCGGCVWTANHACTSNFRQLYVLGTTYAAKHQGHWPTATGEEFWLSLAKTTPPLVEEAEMEIFSCPVRDEQAPDGECHYRGPRVPWSQLKANDPIAADREGNHGGTSINVLLKSGDVLEATPGDPLWKKCREVLGP